ncbi:MAG: photosynthetic complex putative assembly protein PuhB [Burkholderiaceae bacterium]|nr:photosynthetic complex putative assembly protein PuhB [Burkholderiaceae bacterium]
MSMHGHRHAPPGQHEHEFEAAPGLPEPLPAGERLLWQGSPDWRRLALSPFHVRKLAIYFGVIVLARGAVVLGDAGSVVSALIAMLWLLPFVAFALGTLLALAWMTGRTTVYTITDRRVVMRIGIVLTVTYNLPFKHIAGAGLRLHRDGRGDIPLQLAAGDRIAWLQLWPHARPWKVAQPEPMLRAVPDAQHVAELLSNAWAHATGAALPSTARATEATAEKTPGPEGRPAIQQPLATAQ